MAAPFEDPEGWSRNRRLRTRVHAELLKDRRNVTIDGLRGAMQAACKLRVGAALRQQRQDLDFPGGQARRVRAWRFVRTPWYGTHTPFAQAPAHDGSERACSGRCGRGKRPASPFLR